MNWNKSERTSELLAVTLGLLCACNGNPSQQDDGQGDTSGGETETLMSDQSSDSSTKGDDSALDSTMSDSSDGNSQIEESGSGTQDESTDTESTTGSDSTSDESAESSSTGDDNESTTGETGSEEESEDSTTEDACPELNVTFDKVIPNIHLIIDRSGSMKFDFGNQSRWDAVKDVLVESTDNIIQALQDDVRFGLTLYTGQKSNCPNLSPIVNVALNNYTAIKDIYDDYQPGGGTPTGESIEIVAEALNQVSDTGPKLMVLATDGEPFTCADLENNNGEGEQKTIDAVTAAHANGIETYVISVGADISEMHLQDVANAGRGIQPGGTNQPFYEATNRDALVSAFETIINGVRPCIFALDQTIRPGWEDKGEITINGMVIPYDDPNGWQVNSSTEIELLGDACQDIKSGDVEVKVDFSCEAIMPG